MPTTPVPPQSITDPLVVQFIAIPLVLAVSFVAGVWYAWKESGASREASMRAAIAAAAGTAFWMAVSDFAARSGWLRRWDAIPPPLALVVLAIVTLAVAIAFGPAGRRLMTLPMWMLVAVQAFRLPLELAMHSAYERGVMPIQMSYSGRNFDIVTGATAIVVALLVATGYAGRRIVAIWNVLGAVLLVNIVAVAILSTPMFAYFGNDQLNTWIAYPPFVWLPAILVLAAMAGHLIIFRQLANQNR